MTRASEQTSASHVLTLINKIKEAQGGISNHQMSSRAIIEDLILPELHKLASGQPDELSKAAEDVKLLKQQRIHDMNRISDLETTLKAHPDKLSTYFDLVQARRELSKAQARIRFLEEAMNAVLSETAKSMIENYKPKL